MTALLDVRFSFLCRSTYKNENGENPIILRVNFNDSRRDIFTGLYCAKKSWDNSYGRLSRTDKASATINENLDLIVRRALNTYDSLRFSGNPFSIDDLVQKIKGKEEKQQLLVDILDVEIKKIKKRIGIDLTKASYYKYVRTLRYMKEYLESEYKMRNYILHHITGKFLETYFQFLRADKKLSHNVALKYIKITKICLMSAIQSGLIKGDPFRELKIRPKPVHRDFLTQEDLNKLINCDLKDPDLERKRDIFLFACYTGLAFVDLLQLTGNDIQQDPDGSWYIRKNRQKTGEQSIIPLLPAAENILRKYSLSEDIRDFSWFISSNQKMNKGLKCVGKRCGISKTLHMHLARHTFATTVTLSNGVSIESVSKMLGHSNIRITQHYAKVVASKIKSDMGLIKHLFR